MKILKTEISTLKPWAKNARTHSKKQLRQIADSIREFGFTNPVLIDNENTILAGHGRVEAAKLLGMKEVPCVRLESLNEEQKRAYVLADNKLALNAGWDEELLAEELKALIDIDLGFDIGITGFSLPEIDGLIEAFHVEEAGDPRDDVVPEEGNCTARCRPGDIWQLGPHRLACGNSLEAQIVAERTCLWCGDSFVATLPHAAFCCPDHKASAARLRRPRKNPRPISPEIFDYIVRMVA
ncbi:MAG: ParB N-terminal domain-containing protein [Rhodobiaceae bacterium]|nr:ParB N-terminal domain-containing protein [Rhodobiaceae bacterium]